MISALFAHSCSDKTLCGTAAVAHSGTKQQQG